MLRLRDLAGMFYSASNDNNRYKKKRSSKNTVKKNENFKKSVKKGNTVRRESEAKNSLKCNENAKHALNCSVSNKHSFLSSIGASPSGNINYPLLSLFNTYVSPLHRFTTLTPLINQNNPPSATSVRRTSHESKKNSSDSLHNIPFPHQYPPPLHPPPAPNNCDFLGSNLTSTYSGFLNRQKSISFCSQNSASSYNAQENADEYFIQPRSNWALDFKADSTPTLTSFLDNARAALTKHFKLLKVHLPCEDLSKYPITSLDQTTVESKRLVVNVGGDKYEVLWKTLGKLPKTRLGRLLKCRSHEQLMNLCDDYDLNYMEFYFDRQSKTFSTILNYYRTGKLHLQEDACILSFSEDLKYWGIEDIHLESCCQHSYIQRKEMISDEMRKDAESLAESNEEEPVRQGFYHELQRKVWDLLEKPQTSFAARVRPTSSTLLSHRNCPSLRIHDK